MDIAGKVFVVTGGGAGIGRQVVIELLKRGGRVAAVDIRQDRLDGTAGLADAGENLATMVADITDRSAVERLVDGVSASGRPTPSSTSPASSSRSYRYVLWTTTPSTGSSTSTCTGRSTW